jgi:hypothetical protein
MAKLQLDPKKMEVVKKTVTVSAPTGGQLLGKKFAGGAPMNQGERSKFYNSEIARHEKLADQYLAMYKKNPNDKAIKDKYNQIQGALDFLINQEGEHNRQIEITPETMAVRAARKKIAAEEARKSKEFSDKPLMGKVKEVLTEDIPNVIKAVPDVMRRLGSTGGYAGTAPEGSYIYHVRPTKHEKKLD